MTTIAHAVAFADPGDTFVPKISAARVVNVAKASSAGAT